VNADPDPALKMNVDPDPGHVLIKQTKKFQANEMLNWNEYI
jgi:hypothetical protein